jgi:hypothetical protein
MNERLPMPNFNPLVTRLTRIAPLVCAGALALAAPAFASGGAGASGGRASGGGGASNGGHNAADPTPAPTPAPPPPSTTPPVTTPCATITVYTQPTGYVNGGTAIWHNIDIASCNSLPENVDIEAIDKDPKTGQVEYDHYIYTPVTGYGNTGATLDNDLVPYGTTYTITYYVKDASTGKVLASDTASATTPPLN